MLRYLSFVFRVVTARRLTVPPLSKLPTPFRGCPAGRLFRCPPASSGGSFFSFSCRSPELRPPPWLSGWSCRFRPPSLSLFSAFVAPDPILPFIFARYAAAAPRLLNARVPAAVCDLSFYRQVLWCVVRRDSRCRSRSYPPPGMRQPSPDSRTLAFRLQSVTCLFTAKGFVRRDSRWLAAKERKNFLSSAFRYGAASFRLSCCLTFLLIEGLSHALLSNRDRPIMRRVSFQCE